MNLFYEAMQEVLRQPQYDVLTGRAIDFRQVIADAITRLLAYLLERIPWTEPDIPVEGLERIAHIFVAVAVLLIVASAAGTVYLVLRHRRRKAAAQDGLAGMLDDIARRRFTLADLLGQCRTFEEAGHFREAVRHRYMAVLLALHEKKTLRVDKAKTNAQLAQELAAAAPLFSGPFNAVVEVFHAAWFGRKRVDEVRYHAFVAEATKILTDERGA